MSIAGLPKPFRGFTISRMSRTGDHVVAVVMCDCEISMTPEKNHVCKYHFSAALIDKTSLMEVNIRLLWAILLIELSSVVLMQKRPWAGFRSANPAIEVLRESRSGSSPCGILAPPLSGIHWPESRPSGYVCYMYVLYSSWMFKKVWATFSAQIHSCWWLWCLLTITEYVK